MYERKDESGGCEQLRERISKIEPHLHIFGHLHDDGGKSITVGKTTFMNAAIGYRDELYPNKIPEVVYIDI